MVDLSLDLKTQAKKRKLEDSGGGGSGASGKDAVLDLNDSLESFTRKEKLSSAEYSCQKCDGTQQHATKQMSVKKLPPVLSIHLKVRNGPSLVHWLSTLVF